jgi:hypothetical protein
MARLGAAWRGCAGLGAARHGMANTLHLFGGAAVCLGEAWLGEARRGAARRGRAGLGKAWRGKARLGKHTALHGAPQFAKRQHQQMQNETPMTQDLSLRLSICLNGCPIGPRIQRAEPLPNYRHTYSLAEQAVAEADMERVRKYIERNANTMKGKK